MVNKKRIVCLILVCYLLGCRKADSLFQSLSPSDTNIKFENKLEARDHLNILYYLYYYNGGGVSTGDINNDGLPDIYFTANSKGHNKLYLNKGNFKFEDITAAAGVSGTSDWCSGVTMADINGDGKLDIYVSAVANSFGLHGNNQLYINNGNNTFTEMAAEYGLNFSGLCTQAAFFDYDHDGDLDCFLLNHSKKPHANIVDTSNRNVPDAISGGRLYRNDLSTAKKFTDVSVDANIYRSNLSYGLGLSIADINNDGWEDIYIGNDFHENDYYYVNNQDGTFSESGANHFYHYSRFSMGNDVADYNNDGQLDVFTTDMLPPDEKTLKTYGSDENADVYNVKLKVNGYQNQYSKNCLQKNNGDGESFSDVSLMAGISATDWSWCPLFADFDNDGNKDLFITSGIVKRPVDLDYIRFVSNAELRGLSKTDKMDEEVIAKMPDGSSHPFVFKGSGANFTDVSREWGTENLKGFFNGASYADLDNDGTMDVVVNVINAPSIILKNKGPKNNYLSIRFKGNNANTEGLGVKTYIYTKGGLQYQQLMATRGFQSSCNAQLHFGLGEMKIIDSMVVVWPNQKFQVLKNIPANQQLVVNQDDASGQFSQSNIKSSFPLQTIAPLVKWKHKEDDFLDYNVQYLIPHSQSTRGPKLAVGDVNSDGLDDFYVCGAAGQSGALMLQQTNGQFINSDSTVFNKETSSEEVDAIFFDANGDHNLDLYVVSGGNRYVDGAVELLDKLYIGDGRGHFIKAPEGTIPAIKKNKSCISIADIDHDGDTDIFIGTLADAKAYGIPQTSHLLLNNGKGKFDIASSPTINLTDLGLVTTAVFADVNNDGWSDLLVSGEWMPLKIFINKSGKFSSSSVLKSNGLWQSLYITDVNHDGYMDVLAGNWGQNSKLAAGKDGTCKLYVKDFDKNGSIDQLLCYSIDGKEYTFLVKDELERSMPVLKKYYLTFGEVAGKTVDYMFYDLFKDYTELKAETLKSSCFMNDGKGNFIMKDLPYDLQMGPLMCFSSLQPGLLTPSYIAAGNFYGVIPYEGQYDAQQPTIFTFDSAKNAFAAAQIFGPKISELRDIKWLKTKSQEYILVLAQNNGPLQFWKPKKLIP